MLGLPLGLGLDLDMNSGSEDEAADRALNGVARKLDKSLSVEYTVNELISGAMDVVNLAKMYYGEFFFYPQPSLRRSVCHMLVLN